MTNKSSRYQLLKNYNFKQKNNKFGRKRNLLDKRNQLHAFQLEVINNKIIMKQSKEIKIIIKIFVYHILIKNKNNKIKNNHF